MSETDVKREYYNTQEVITQFNSELMKLAEERGTKNEKLNLIFRQLAPTPGQRSLSQNVRERLRRDQKQLEKEIAANGEKEELTLRLLMPLLRTQRALVHKHNEQTETKIKQDQGLSDQEKLERIKNLENVISPSRQVQPTVFGAEPLNINRRDPSSLRTSGISGASLIASGGKRKSRKRKSRKRKSRKRTKNQKRKTRLRR